MCDLPHDPVGDPLGDALGFCFCVNTQPQAPGAPAGSCLVSSRGAGGQTRPQLPQLWLLLPKAGSSRQGVTHPRPALCAEGQAQVGAVLKPWVTFNQGGRSFCKQSRGHPDSTRTPHRPPREQAAPPSVTLPGTNAPHSLWGAQHRGYFTPGSHVGPGRGGPQPPQGAGPPAVAHGNVEEGPHHPRVAREPRDPQENLAQRQVHMETARSRDTPSARWPLPEGR